MFQGFSQRRGLVVTCRDGVFGSFIFLLKDLQPFTAMSALDRDKISSLPLTNIYHRASEGIYDLPVNFDSKAFYTPT